MLRLPAYLLLACIGLLPEQLQAHAGTQEQLTTADRKIHQSPNDAELYRQRGVIYSHAGEQDKAVADFERAAMLGDPTRVAHDLGVAYYRSGDFTRAQQYFDQYLQRFPGHAASHEYRARVFRDMGEYSLAERAMQQYFAHAKQPNPGNYIIAADLLLAADRNATDRALAVLDDGLERLGMVPQIQRRAIEIERQRAHFTAAVARMGALEDVLGGSVHWQVDMAELLVEARRFPEARILLEQSRGRLLDLRKTPARLRLVERIEMLEQQLKN